MVALVLAFARFGIPLFKHCHKICALVLYVRPLGDILCKTHQRFGILLFGEFNIERFMLFISQYLGDLKADKLVFFVNMRLLATTLELCHVFLPHPCHGSILTHFGTIGEFYFR